MSDPRKARDHLLSAIREIYGAVNSPLELQQAGLRMQEALHWLDDWIGMPATHALAHEGQVFVAGNDCGGEGAALHHVLQVVLRWRPNAPIDPRGVFHTGYHYSVTWSHDDHAWEVTWRPDE